MKSIAEPTAITVVVVTRNRRDLLCQTLESLLRCDDLDLGDCEILVVDNGSTDDTRQAVEDMARGAQVPVRFVVEPEVGASRARNCGFRESRGELIAFLDDDVEVDKGWVKALREVSRQYPNAAAFGGRATADWIRPPPRWLAMSGPYEVRAGAYVAHDRGDESFRYHRRAILPITANCAVRRWAWRKYGGFRPDLDRKGKELLSGGDTEFFRRLILGGDEVVYAPKMTVSHPAIPERLTKSYVRRWHFHFGRSMVRMFGIPEGSVRWLGIPRYLFRELLGACGQCLYSALTFQRHRLFFYELDLRRVLGRMKEARAGTKPMDPPPAE